MRKSFLSLTLFVLGVNIFFAVPAHGQTRRLGLEEARELGLRNSRGLARYNLNIQNSLLSEKIQGYASLPSLSLGVSSGTTVWDLNEGSSAEMIKDSFSAEANARVSQTIWDGGKNSIHKAIAALGTESARQDALAEYYSVLDSVDSAFYAVLEAQASLEAAESSLETANLSLSIAEIRRQGGMMSAPDYLKALAEKESGETSRNQSRRDLSLTKLKFKNLLGLKEELELEPVNFESLEDLVAALAKIDDEDFERLLAKFRASIARKNPGLIRAGISSSIAEKNLSLAKRNYYSLSLNASASAGAGYKIASGFEPSGSVTISLGGSIGDFWVTAANVKKSKIAADETAMDYRNAVESFDVDLQSCLLNLISQAGQILSSERAMDYAELNFDQVLELYRLGQSSQSALSDAEVLLRNNRNQFTQKRYAFLSGLSALRSLGAYGPEDEISILLSELGLR